MNILLLGGSGFIGRHVAKHLQSQGHVLRLPRRSELNVLRLDSGSLSAQLTGVDVVVNAVGVMSRDAAVLETVHHHAMRQIAEAAVQAGVSHWVQLSALGADAAHPVAFLGSKGRGDAAVAASGLSVNIARPSVVYGRGGASCELFLKLARLPYLLLPERGRFMLQPVHVTDVAAGLGRMVQQPLPSGSVVAMVGREAMTLAEYLSTLRQTVHGRGPLRVGQVPQGLMDASLPLSNVLSNGMLSRDSMSLLQQGSYADAQGFAALLGHLPLGVSEFAAADRHG